MIIIASGRSWWKRYQPVTYNLTTRSGNEVELSDIISRCDKVDSSTDDWFARISAEVVLNHMAGLPSFVQHQQFSYPKLGT
jgi:alpha-amylase